ncbi:MAG: amino acid-binding ACT domain-containing protein [Ferrimicrobium sp.]
MYDVEVAAPDGAASLALLGQVLGNACVGLEGGGMWSGVAHYLVEDAVAAENALTNAGIGPVVCNEVVIAELDADIPGALGRMMQQLVEGGVRLLSQYSDHDNRKVLIVDDAATARAILDRRT